MVPDDTPSSLDPTIARETSASSGDRIGPYRLLERLGEGGMGEVWKAEQLEPVRRTVAVKLIKAGMDTRQVIARFEAERQALAMMDHPGIAKVFDAGETPLGRPYFVMEFVPGEAITDYCDKRRLTTGQRLALFQQVCEAVQHAHQKAVIHRDLKPGNILVQDLDGRPSPKIIDFGVAKATSQRLTDKTLYTRIGQFIGTPAYMSPEQAEMTNADVDTRSDVYSLGVLFYQLLVGALPFETEDLMRAGYAEVLRILREDEPPRPSTKLSGLGERTTEIAEHRRTRPRSLGSELRGDLDWIAMKALEKDRNRRYESAAEMSRDIQRHIDHEPLVAGPPSAGYRIGKFVRRHRSGVMVASAALVVLVAFAVVTWIQSQRIATERDIAVTERQRAEAAHLYTLSESAESDLNAFSYAVASLEMADQEHVRVAAMEALARSPQPQSFASGGQGWHNPFALAISPDGRWTAIGWAMGGHLNLHPEDGGEPIAFEGHQGMICQLAFTPDSQRLISTAIDGTLRIWSVPEGEELARLDLTPGSFVFFQLLDGEGDLLILDYQMARELRWRRWRAGDPEAEMLASWEPEVYRRDSPPVAADPHGPGIFFGQDERLMRLSLEQLPRAEGEVIGLHDAPIDAVYASPDGSQVISVGENGSGRLWDLRHDPPRLWREFPVGESPIGAGWSPDLRQVAIGRSKGITLLDLSSPLGSDPRALEFADWRWSFFPRFHPRHPWLIETGTGGEVVAWPLNRRVPLRFGSTQGAMVIAFTPDGSALLVAEEGRVRRFPLSGDPGDPPASLLELEGHSFTSLYQDASGRHLVTGVVNSERGNGSIHLVDTQTGEHRSWQEQWYQSGGAKIDPTGRYLAVVNDAVLQGVRHLCRIMDVREDDHVDVEFGDDVGLRPWGWLEDGGLLLQHGAEVFRVDPVSGERALFLDGVKSGFQSSRRWLLWTDTTDTLRITDLAEGETGVLDLRGRKGRLLEIDSTGRYLALARGNGAIDVVARDGSFVHRLHGHEGGIHWVAFDPAGRWLASVSLAEDDPVRLWPMPTASSPDELAYEELLPLLRSQTTWRVIPDEESPTRYGFEREDFAGWDPPPVW